LSAPLVVLDTGVVIRALAGDEHAASAQVVRAISTGSLRLVLSDDFLRELVTVARRPAIERRIKAGRALETGLELGLHGELRHPRRLDWPSVPDRKDWWILDLAHDAAADFIVAWDPHLLPPNVPPIPATIITPASLLDRMEETPQDRG
jgi:predicted nucleic acid-binding protein